MRTGSAKGRSNRSCRKSARCSGASRGNRAKDCRACSKGRMSSPANTCGRPPTEMPLLNPSLFSALDLSPRPIGLTGLDPRFVDDPRFEPIQRSIIPSGPFAGHPVLYWPRQNNDAVTNFDPRVHMTYLADVDDKTL